MQISKSYHQEFQQIAENRQIIAEFIPPVIPDGIGTPWLELNENHNFTIGTEEGNEIRHFPNSPITQNEQGIFISRTGWMKFDLLSWNRETIQYLDFVFYCQGNRTLTFGLANESFNHRSSRFQQIVCGFRILRNRVSYCYGNNFTNYDGYVEIARNSTYRFRINQNGERGKLAQLFQLNSINREDWDYGSLIW
ncbi:MAG: hypothetical protein AB4372_16865, partial [Xenococcus sp. (in: cyanobacteria)]